jgi:predicted Zn-dependent protease
MMKNYFYSFSDYIAARLKTGETHLLYFSGEVSDFARLNHCKIRQAGKVSQNYLKLSLVQGQKIASHEFIFTGDQSKDEGLVNTVLDNLRDRLSVLPEDPYLLYSEDVQSSEEIAVDRLPENDAVMDEIFSLGEGKDLVGIYASGLIAKGFANSLGQKNWFQKYNYNFDWSVYYKDDKAVKQSYAGFEWDSKIFREKIEGGLNELNILAQAPITISPGKYRIYIAPSAFDNFVGMLNWGGFGLKSHKTKDSPLIKMIEEGKTLDASISMLENTRAGICPRFDSFGFVKPDSVTLVKDGVFHHPLVSPRSAKEFNVDTNGASSNEATESFEMRPGSIDRRDILKILDTGVYMNNAWYLNFSDRNNCRVTGMTRFACFWVENGEIIAPLNVMRFDESILRMLGENLVGLTKDRDFLISASTYYQRGTRSVHLPGVMMDDFTFTL